MNTIYLKDPVGIPQFVARQIGIDVTGVARGTPLCIEREELVKKLRAAGNDSLAGFYERRAKHFPRCEECGGYHIPSSCHSL